MLSAADFAGTWLLDRQVTDHAGGQDAVLQGQVALLPDGQGGLIYDETGTLRLAGGPPMQTTRRYLWQFGPDGVDVRFADGAPFHSFRPAGAVAGTDHPCGADFYTVRYDFTGWPVWHSTWVVRGPRKDYTMQTEFRRAEAA